MLDDSKGFFSPRTFLAFGFLKHKRNQTLKSLVTKTLKLGGRKLDYFFIFFIMSKLKKSFNWRIGRYLFNKVLKLFRNSILLTMVVLSS